MLPHIVPNEASLSALERIVLPQGLPSTGYIRQSQLIPAIIPISPATLWRWVRTGHFVAPVKLSDNVTAWRCEDVRRWMDTRGAK